MAAGATDAQTAGMMRESRKALGDEEPRVDCRFAVVKQINEARWPQDEGRQESWSGQRRRRSSAQPQFVVRTSAQLRTGAGTINTWRFGKAQGGPRALAQPLTARRMGPGVRRDDVVIISDRPWMHANAHQTRHERQSAPSSDADSPSGNHPTMPAVFANPPDDDPGKWSCRPATPSTPIWNPGWITVGHRGRYRPSRGLSGGAVIRPPRG